MISQFPVIQLVALLIGLVLILFWLWMLVDMANNDYISGSSKTNWFIAFVFLNIFATFWYYFVEYRPRHL